MADNNILPTGSSHFKKLCSCHFQKLKYYNLGNRYYILQYFPVVFAYKNYFPELF